MLTIAVLLAFTGLSDPDAPVATAPSRLASPDSLVSSQPPAAQDAGPAPSAAHGLTTSEQIDRWLTARSQLDTPAAPFAEDDQGPRRVHGEVSVGIGTGGYRDYGGTVIVPLGEKGTLGLSYHRTENGFRAYYFDPLDPYAADAGFGVARPSQFREYETRLSGPSRMPEDWPAARRN